MSWPTVAKMVFGHYFTPYPISFDNLTARPDHYDTILIKPGGTTVNVPPPTLSSVFGGFLRDRQIFRPKIAGTTWSDTDYQTEVKNAKAGGLDGWTMDLLTAAPHPAEQLQVMNAAIAVGGFKIMLMPDGGSWNSSIPAGSGRATTAAARITPLAAKSSVFTLTDGRLVLAPFHAEIWSVSDWNAVIAAIESATGMTVAFVPCFLDISNLAGFASGITAGKMFGASTWGNRNPAAQTGQAANAANAHSKGLIYMQPVSVQDERPYLHVYDEARNTQNLRDSWAAACGFSGGFTGTPITNGVADWVQIPTWNDFSEGAHLCPSEQHGFAYLKLSQHYATLWKAGQTPSTMPTPTSDEIYLTHRVHSFAAAAGVVTGGQTSYMTLRSGSSSATDLIECLTILTASATVTITVNGVAGSPHTQPAGISFFTQALGVGVVSAKIVRSGVTIATVTTPRPVVAAPAVQDLQYIAAFAAAVGPPVIVSPAVSTTLNVTTASTTATDPAGGVIGYQWDWGDTSTPDITASATHTYSTPGTFTVTLTITSSVSGQNAVQTFNETVTIPGGSTTPYMGYTLPITGQLAGLFGPAERQNLTITDRQILNMVNAMGASIELPSATFPNGRILIAASDPFCLDVGEETLTRGRDDATTGAVALVSGQVRFTYFQARKTEAITQVRMLSGGTNASGLTLAQAGIYSVNPSTGALALLASTTNDTSLFAAANTAYTKSLSATVNKVAGTVYAYGQLVVGTTPPTVTGRATIAGGVVGEAALSPRRAAVLTAATLPSTATDASLTSTGSLQYAVLVP